MKQEHQYLARSIASKPDLHAALSSCNDNVSFDAGWSILKGRFESLKRFVGMIASVFPGMAQVESKFSIVDIGKDDFRRSLTDLLFEGIIHSRQYAILSLI